MRAVWVKTVGEHTVTGKQDDEKNYLAECTCGHSYWGFQDYWALRSWISKHAMRHTLKAVSR